MVRHSNLAFFGLLALAMMPALAVAGGPKYIAGSSYFNSGLEGQPIAWANGKISYYVDQGALSSYVTHTQAVAMVDAAAALWSNVATAAVALSDQGTLAEDVTGSNLKASSRVITAPADVTPAATGYSVAVLFDADGAIIDALYGEYSSEPLACQKNGVYTRVDNFGVAGTIAHAVIILNGRCASSDDLVATMNWGLERAFGRVLGLDSSQVNPTALSDGNTDALAAWPVMQPESGMCGAAGGDCLPNPGTLSYDDIAALNRLYPVTAANQSSFTGKTVTATATVSITGTVSFKTGQGMQGVNVVARPLDASGNPMYQYTVTSVSGFRFNGNHGNAITGTTDSSGNALSRWGSTDTALQGYFDLGGMPLPPGMSSAQYQISFESIEEDYVKAYSVGPYLLGSPTISGSLATVTVAALSPGGSKTLAVKATGSAAGGVDAAIGSASQPRSLPVTGFWSGRLTEVGAGDWYEFSVRSGRKFTVMTLALDESNTPTARKAMPVLAVWDALLIGDSTPVASAAALDGWTTGQSWIQVTTATDDTLRLGIVDARGDGRPDYSYTGMVLYADTVEPARLTASGGAIILHGNGFRLTDTVTVGGKSATITNISPTEIDAVAPASSVTGSVNVVVTDTAYSHVTATISDGISYDAGSDDALTLVSAPSGTVSIGVPENFSVQALAPDLTGAGGVKVIYKLVSGKATLGCGATTCMVIAGGDGSATLTVTPTDTNLSVVTASLSNGSSLQCEFTGGTAPTLVSLSKQLSVAAGATVTWTVQALVLNGGNPMSGQAVAWTSSVAGLAPQGTTAAISNSSGVAQKVLVVSGLAKGETATAKACLNGTSTCVNYSVFGARPEYASVLSVSGMAQSLEATATPNQVVLRLEDMNGNPMAGGTVTLYESLYAWTPPCGRHGRCAQAQLLKTAAATVTSGIDGSVIFTPISISGVATRLVGVAVTGYSSTLNLEIEQHP
jgi:hypothetical protein